MLVVAHDPGHGPSPGCVHNGILERDYVFSLAQDIAAGIPWVKHVLLRGGPEGADYTVRANAAKEAGAQLVFLHHVNAIDDPTERGMLTFFASKQSGKLANVVSNVVATCGPYNIRNRRSIGATESAWPRVHWCLEKYLSVGLDPVLLEWGFSTNADEARTLLNPATRPGQVAAVACGIAAAIAYLHQA